MPLTTGQKEWWAPPFSKDRKTTNTVDLQILFYNDKGNKETSSYGKEKEARQAIQNIKNGQDK